MVVSIVLERNPELEFSDKVDLDSLVKEAFNDFQRDRSCFEGIEKQVEWLRPGRSGELILSHYYHTVQFHEAFEI